MSIPSQGSFMEIMYTLLIGYFLIGKLPIDLQMFIITWQNIFLNEHLAFKIFSKAL